MKPIHPTGRDSSESEVEVANNEQTNANNDKDKTVNATINTNKLQNTT